MAQDELSTGEAAQTAGLSVSTIKRRIQAKELQARRTEDGEWVIQHGDLMAFLAAHKPASRKGASGRPTTLTAHEPHTSRQDEALGREVTELKNERMKLTERIERLDRENRDLMREYNAMMVRMVCERDEMIRELRSCNSTASKAPEIEDVPTRFLAKLKKVAQAIRD